jgi:hypothetical protein
MISEQSSTPALFGYLDDEQALPPDSRALSRRELVRQAFEALRSEKKADFQRALCSRLGDPSRTLGERTRLFDIASVIRPDRQTRRLIRRQILDDVRALFGAQGVPGTAGPDYVRRLRCLLEIGTVESPRFWKTAYQLCGSSCSLIVFTALHARQPELALDWLTTYLSPWEQSRVLEKALPAIRQQESLDNLRNAELALSAATHAGPDEEPKDREWREILISILNGSLNVEVDRTGLMEYLRDKAIHYVRPEIERQERHLRIAVDRLFEDWASRRLKLELKPTLRLLMLTREFRSLRVLSSLVSYLELLDRQARGSSAAVTSFQHTIEIAILDCFPWFDAVIENLSRSSSEEGGAQIQALLARILSILRTLRTKPDLSDRADRELVKHSQTKEERIRALISMLSKSDHVTDWIEDLDRRMQDDFQGLVYTALQDYRLQAHLRNRLASLAEWCDDVYTTRDRLLGGSGWITDPGSGDIFREIAEAREYAEFEDLLEAVAAGVGQVSEGQGI